MLRYKNLRSNVKGVCKNTWVRGTKMTIQSVIVKRSFWKVDLFVHVGPNVDCSVNAVDLSCLSSSLRSWFGGVLRVLHRLFARILLHLESTPCRNCHSYPAITIYSSLEKFYWVPPPPWHGRELGRWDLITSNSKLWSIYWSRVDLVITSMIFDVWSQFAKYSLQLQWIMITVDTPKHPKVCLTVFPALSLGLTRICASFKVFESSDPLPPNSLPQSNSCANSKAFICLRRKIGIACIHVVSLKFILYSTSWYLESWGLCRIYYLWGILKLLQSVTGPPAAKRRILGESIWKQMQVRGFPVTRLSMLGRQFLNWSIISRY